MPLADGSYTAFCKERTALSASVNGHGRVYPQADMKVRDGWAHFYRDGVEVWHCNGAYAETHFKIMSA